MTVSIAEKMLKPAECSGLTRKELAENDVDDVEAAQWPPGVIGRVQIPHYTHRVIAARASKQWTGRQSTRRNSNVLHLVCCMVAKAVALPKNYSGQCPAALGQYAQVQRHFVILRQYP